MVDEAQRKIIHVDMDCFYAAIEMRDDPALRGLPVAVGGAADRRGVLTTCNYEAREYGLHSAMATAYALRLCPNLTLLPVRMAYYRSVSNQIREILARYTDQIEPLSLDEAYLDVTGSSQFHGSATLIAEHIRATIRRELGLTASAGIAPNKFLAKVASDENKPDGQCVVAPDRIEQFVAQLELKKIPGVGKVTLEKLAKHRLFTCGDVRDKGETEMVRLFGGLGELLYRCAYGIDDRPVQTHRVRKSLSVERTFARDIPDADTAAAALDELFEELSVRLERQDGRPIRGQQLKLKFSDFRTTTIERSSHALSKSLYAALLPLAFERGEGLGIRLLGIGVSFREDPENQLKLF